MKSFWAWRIYRKLLFLSPVMHFLLASLKGTVVQAMYGKPNMFFSFQRSYSSSYNSLTTQKILLFLSAMHEMEYKPLWCPYTILVLRSVSQSSSSGVVDPPELYAPLLLLPPSLVCGGESRCQMPRGECLRKWCLKIGALTVVFWVFDALLRNKVKRIK